MVTKEPAPVLLLHGWPHTARLWERITPSLARRHVVLAPELWWPGGGVDAGVVVTDLVRRLDDAGVAAATVVAMDAGVTPAVLLALTHPERVARLVVTEGLLPGLAPGFPHGAPWWFGFHAVPGLAEAALAGNEAAYVRWFLTAHVEQPVPSAIRAAFEAAYAEPGALGRSLAPYRSRERDAAFLTAALPGRLRVPTLAVAGGVVGGLLAEQLRPVTDELTEASVEDCGHLVPLEQPERLLELLGEPLL